MAVELADTLAPKNNGNFPVAKAEHIEMPDGTKLSDQLVIKSVSELPKDAEEHPNVIYIIVEGNTETAAEDGDDP